MVIEFYVLKLVDLIKGKVITIDAIKKEEYKEPTLVKLKGIGLNGYGNKIIA